MLSARIKPFWSHDYTLLILGCWLLLLRSSDAFVIQTASATRTCQNLGLAYQIIPHATPAPTPHGELRARQASSTSLATCGYINGDGDLAVTCGANLYCATTSTYVGCCERTNCFDIFTTCYDLLGAVCDSACQNNPQNLVCPSSLPYCARYNYEGGSIGIGCARVSGYTTTVLLQSRTNTIEILPSADSTTSPVTTVTAPPAPQSSGLSTGATAGIAVGVTLAVVAALLVAWIFWRRHKKTPKTGTDAQVAVPYEAKEVAAASRPDRGSKAISEMPSSPRTPMSPEFYAQGQPSPGLPKYSQHPTQPTQYHEMEGDARPVSYAPTELSSSRGGVS